MLLKVKALIILSAISTCSYAKGGASGFLNPYIGIGAKINHLKWEKGCGNNIFNHKLPAGEIFLGAYVHDNIAFDIGYYSTPTQKRLTTLNSGDSFLGLSTDMISAPPVQFLSYVQTKGGYGLVNGFWPLGVESSWKIIGQAGLVHANVTQTTHTLADVDGDFNFSATKRLFKAKKLLPRLGMGLQYEPTQASIGIRGTLHWDNTRRLGQMQPKNNPALKGRVKMGNTLSYGLSVYYKFS